MFRNACIATFFLVSGAIAQGASGARVQGAGVRGQPLKAQKKADEKPFSKPFRYRSLTKDIDLKDRKEFVKLLSDLSDLYRNWYSATDRGFDEAGRPFTKAPFFLKLRDDLMKRLTRKGGMLKAIMLGDRSAARRLGCYFGALFVPETQDGVHLLRYLPHEPQTTLRHQAIAFSREFLKVHVTLKTVTALGREGDSFAYLFDTMPWIDLTRAPNTADRVLGYQILADHARARPPAAAATAQHMRPWMPDNLRSKNAGLAGAARAFVEAVEPEARMPKEAEAAVAYWHRVMRKLFPDVRLAGGNCALYPGPDLDKIVAVGMNALRVSKIGKVEHVVIKTRLGKQNRVGIRIRDLPEPLEKLGLQVGDLVTTLNGSPIVGCGELLRMIEDHLAAGTKVFHLEWIGKDKAQRARQYFLRQRQ